MTARVEKIMREMDSVIERNRKENFTSAEVLYLADYLYVMLTQPKEKFETEVHRCCD